LFVFDAAKIMKKKKRGKSVQRMPRFFQ